MSMFDRLEDTLRRYEDVTAELGNPDIVTDQDKFRKYMKEQSNLAPIVEAYTEYKASKQNIEDSLQMISEESDEELLEMAREELADSKKRVEELEKKLKILLLPKDPNDDKDIVVEIRAGAGGEEAALFAGTLFRMYNMYAERKHWKLEILNENATVTICHSRTVSLPEVCREADILVTAIGKAKWIDERFVSEKTIVIDVGINVDENGMLCGDVNFGQIEDKVFMATPVPGGVGAVTTAVLAKHVLEAAKGRRALNSKGGKNGLSAD